MATENANILAGLENHEDAAIYKLTEDLALVQTVDFFTPIVDDPYMFGQIAAANALSDVYAMGGEPKTVLNLVAFPISSLGHDVLARILQGSYDKVQEAGAEVVGGHSIDDAEPKFGLSVTGIVHPERYYRNNGAKPGDVLVLTKPIGVGIQTTALKRNSLTRKQIERVTTVMRTLNKSAKEALTSFHPHAVTDVTGFGLLGHAYEMAKGSKVTFEIFYHAIPQLEGTEALAREGIIPGGSHTNYQWLEDKVAYDEALEMYERLILTDAITSGGFLISLPEKEAKAYIQRLGRSEALQPTIIGRVTERKEKFIDVVKEPRRNF